MSYVRFIDGFAMSTRIFGAVDIAELYSEKHGFGTECRVGHRITGLSVIVRMVEADFAKYQTAEELRKRWRAMRASAVVRLRKQVTKIAESN